MQKKKFARFVSLCVVLAGGAATVAGCGGGNSFGQTDVRRFKGTYDGTFTTVSSGFTVASGTFVGTRDEN